MGSFIFFFFKKHFRLLKKLNFDFSKKSLVLKKYKNFFKTKSLIFNRNLFEISDFLLKYKNVDEPIFSELFLYYNNITPFILNKFNLLLEKQKNIFVKRRNIYKKTKITKNLKEKTTDEIEKINQMKKFAQIFQKVFLQVKKREKLKNFFEKKKKEKVNFFLNNTKTNLNIEKKNLNIEKKNLNIEKKNLNTSEIDIDFLFQKRIKNNNNEKKNIEVDPAVKLLEDIRHIVYGTKIEKKDNIVKNNFNDFFFVKKSKKKIIKKTVEEKMKIKKNLEKLIEFLFEKKYEKIQNLFLFKLFLKKIRKNKFNKIKNLLKLNLFNKKFNKKFNNKFINKFNEKINNKQDNKKINKKQEKGLYKIYFNKLRNKDKAGTLPIKYQNGKIRKIEVYSEKFKKVMRVIPKYRSLFADHFKT